MSITFNFENIKSITNDKELLKTECKKLLRRFIDDISKLERNGETFRINPKESAIMLLYSLDDKLRFREEEGIKTIIGELRYISSICEINNRENSVLDSTAFGRR
ncbi:hypothetical protein D3C81_1781440 [compost metagenome]